jgi:hypothetical protein
MDKMAESQTYSIETLITALADVGYTDVKKLSDKKVAVLTDKNRVSTLEDIQIKLRGQYDPSPSSESSVGRVRVQQFQILAKPAGKQGKASAGVGNEDFLIDWINDTAKTGPINVIFKSPNHTYVVNGCKKATSVGTDTAGRKKADVILEDMTGVKYSISIKKDDAETWESADSYFSTEAKGIIDKAVVAKKTKLVKHSTYYTIEPNIAVHAKLAEKKAVVFGSDLIPGGAVITKTFASSSFSQEDDTLTVTVSNIITKLEHVYGDKDVYFLIRNDKTRKSIKEYPGIRVLASYKKRINKNVIVVER